MHGGHAGAAVVVNEIVNDFEMVAGLTKRVCDHAAFVGTRAI